MTWSFYDSQGRQLSVGEQGQPGPGVPNGGAPGEVLAKASASNQDTEWVNLDERYAPVSERQTLTTTVQVSPGQSVNLDLPLARIFGLIAISASDPCRLRLYSTSSARGADASRSESQAPVEDSGLICDIKLTSDLLSLPLSPPQIGSCLENPSSPMVSAILRNDSVSASNVELTLTWYPIEHAFKAPINLAAPEIAGSAEVGQPLVSSSGDWDAYPTPSLAFQWEISADGSTWTEINGATSQTYTPVSGDSGKTVRVKVTATNSRGASTDSSDPSSTITA